MNEFVLSGSGNQLTKIPVETWKLHVEQAPQNIAPVLDFMTEEHHRVRYHVVRELPGLGRPITPEEISGATDLTMDRTIEILDELEKHLFFLVRNEKGAVSWAFPMTADGTPHQLSFNTGERLNAA